MFKRQPLRATILSGIDTGVVLYGQVTQVVVELLFVLPGAGDTPVARSRSRAIVTKRGQDIKASLPVSYGTRRTKAI